MNVRLFPILGIILINFIALGVVIPMLPSLAVHFHVAPLTIGLMFAMYPLCQFISGPLWGNLSDHIGRKAVLVLSLSSEVVAWLIIAFAPDIHWVFLGRAIDGVFGSSTSVAQAAIADAVAPEKRTQSYGHLGLAFGLGMLLGPLIGITGAHGGYSTPFLTTAGLMLLALILALAFFPENRAHGEKPKTTVSFSEIVIIFQDPRLAYVLLQRIALLVGLTAWFSVEVLFLTTKLRFGIQAVCAFYAVKAGVIMLTNGFLVGWMTKRINDQGIACIGFFLQVVAFTLVPFIDGIPLLIIMSVFLCMGGELTNAGMIASITKLASAKQQGTALGVCSSIDALSGIIGPILATVVFGKFGASSSGFVSLSCLMVALIMGVFAVLPHLTREDPV
ncbi:MAG TPA: MFS transporter [Candidatus Baltobacteraceae bacterium]|jgi:DHA1 family tetracycline resistance protein-like MFS transporter|nr:MFS transporter [Candidatus Baltobacteraceae bacterium]